MLPNGQLFKILVRELPRKRIEVWFFLFAFQSLSSPELQRAQRLGDLEIPVPFVVCSTRGSCCTSKLCQLYVGFGEPSWEMQVRLIVCPYSAVPTILHSGLDGATEGRKKQEYCYSDAVFCFNPSPASFFFFSWWSEAGHAPTTFSKELKWTLVPNFFVPSWHLSAKKKL